MKKIYILFFICFISTFVFAQSNLQYSQAKLISTNDTVPAGKVWKVEGVIYSSTVPFAWYTNGTAAEYLLINNLLVNVRVASVNNSYNLTNSIIWEQKFPLWFPAGTTLAPSTGVLYINVVEFNTVQ